MALSKSIWVVVLSAMVHFANAQLLNDVHIKFKIAGLSADATCRLAYYHGSKQYVKDNELSLEEDGYIHFRGDSIVSGIYLLVFPNKSYLEFLLTERSFTLTTSIDELVLDMVVEGSEDNQVFFDYLKFIGRKSKEIQDLSLVAGEQASPEQEAQKLRIGKEVMAYQQQLVKEYARTAVGIFVKGNIESPVAQAPEGMTEAEAQNFVLYQYRRHFFDHIDWTSSLLWRSPILSSKIQVYLEKLTYALPDSQIVAVQRILKMVEEGGNKDMFQYILIDFVNRYALSKLICFDKVYVYLVENYYLVGKASWISKESLTKMNQRVSILRNVQCGKMAPNISLPNTEGTMLSLWDIEAEHLVLLFWKPGCQSCQATAQQLRDLQNTMPDKLSVVAVCTTDSKDEWLDWIRTNNLEKWVNLYNAGDAYDFSQLYDVNTAPMLYVLDEKLLIQQKRIDVSSLEALLK